MEHGSPISMLSYYLLHHTHIQTYSGNPSKYWLSTRLLNCSDHTRTAIWKLYRSVDWIFIQELCGYFFFYDSPVKPYILIRQLLEVLQTLSWTSTCRRFSLSHSKIGCGHLSRASTCQPSGNLWGSDALEVIVQTGTQLHALNPLISSCENCSLQLTQMLKKKLVNFPY